MSHFNTHVDDVCRWWLLIAPFIQNVAPVVNKEHTVGALAKSLGRFTFHV